MKQRIIIITTSIMFILTACGNNNASEVPQDIVANIETEQTESNEQSDTEQDNIENNVVTENETITNNYKLTTEDIDTLKNILNKYNSTESKQIYETYRSSKLDKEHTVEINKYKDYGTEYIRKENGNTMCEVYVDEQQGISYIEYLDNKYKIIKTEEIEYEPSSDVFINENILSYNQISKKSKGITEDIIQFIIDSSNSINKVIKEETDESITISLECELGDSILAEISIKYTSESLLESINLSINSTELQLNIDIDYSYAYSILDVLKVPDDLRHNAEEVDGINKEVFEVISTNENEDNISENSQEAINKVQEILDNYISSKENEEVTIEIIKDSEILKDSTDIAKETLSSIINDEFNTQQVKNKTIIEEENILEVNIIFESTARLDVFIQHEDSKITNLSIQYKSRNTAKTMIAEIEYLYRESE